MSTCKKKGTKRRKKREKPELSSLNEEAIDQGRKREQRRKREEKG